MRPLVLGLWLSCSAFAGADILWDQSTLDPNGVGLANQEFSDFPTYSTYIVSDIVVTAPWHVGRMTQYYVNGSSTPNWSGLTQGRLNIFPKTGSLPGAGNDPGTGIVVPITVASGSLNPVVTASLNLDLNPGNYWIGLTPLTAFGTHGQAFLAQALGVHGDPDAIRNPGGGFAFGTSWMPAGTIPGGHPGYEAAFKLNWPEPSSLVLISLGVLLRRRH